MLQLVAFIVLIAVCAPSYQQVCDQPLINNVADFIMQQLLSKYPNNIVIANISSSFLYDAGTIEANYGNLASFSTIRRYGDVLLHMQNSSSVNIILNIKFQYLTVAYEEYKLKVAGLSTAGSLQTSVMDNLIEINATMGEKSLCFITVNSIKFLKLGDFEVRLRSSCSYCSKITSSVTSAALNYFKTKIKSMVQAKINQALHKIIKPDNRVICNKLYSFISD